MSKKGGGKGRRTRREVASHASLLAIQIMLAAALGSMSETEAVEAMGMPPEMFAFLREQAVAAAVTSVAAMRSNGDTWIAWHQRNLEAASK